ncbi:MAG: hypothetical protein VKJ06_04160 [Vampirovibrionales bacterium]|nr:hypothetical protein [Vampirovibrionales bacterium]
MNFLQGHLSHYDRRSPHFSGGSNQLPEKRFNTLSMGVQKPVKPQFGSAVGVATHSTQAALSELGPLTRMARNAYELIAGDAGRRLITMDLVGWGGLRTYIDLYRENFEFDHLKAKLTGQSDTQTKTPQKNEAAATERIKREIYATLSDVMVAGPLVAMGTAVADKFFGAYTGNFIDLSFLQQIQQHAKTLGKNAQIATLKPESALQNLYEHLAESIVAEDVTAAQRAAIKKLLTPESLAAHAKPPNAMLKPFNSLIGRTKLQLDAAPLSEQISKILGREGDFDIVLKHGKNKLQSQLPDLLHNMYKFQEKFLANTTPETLHWVQHLEKQLGKSVVTRMALPVTLLGVLAINLMTPHKIQVDTIKQFGISTYPGDPRAVSHPKLSYGREDAKQQALQAYNEKPWNEKYFEYLSQAWKNKNPLPFVGALAFAPFVLGLYKAGHGFKFHLPEGVKPNQLKHFVKELAKRHDFDKTFPWAAEQQQATTYAATLFSRILSARTPTEFVERLSDSFLSYASAFELTPMLSSKVAKLTETKLKNTKLFKANGALRTEQEILALKDPLVRSATLKAKTWLNWGLLVGTTLVMGTLAPIACIALATIGGNKRSKHQAPPMHYPVAPLSPGNFSKMPVAFNMQQTASPFALQGASLNPNRAAYSALPAAIPLAQAPYLPTKGFNQQVQHYMPFMPNTFAPNYIGTTSAAPRQF